MNAARNGYRSLWKVTRADYARIGFPIIRGWDAYNAAWFGVDNA